MREKEWNSYQCFNICCWNLLKKIKLARHSMKRITSQFVERQNLHSFLWFFFNFVGLIESFLFYAHWLKNLLNVQLWQPKNVLELKQISIQKYTTRKSNIVNNLFHWKTNSKWNQLDHWFEEQRKLNDK